MADMTNARFVLSLNASLPEARLAQLTRDISRDLSRAGMHAQLVETPSAFGERGDIVSLGQIALGLVTSGAVTALIECFRVYLARERVLTIKLTRADGTQVEVNARNVDASAVRQALEAVVMNPPR